MSSHSKHRDRDAAEQRFRLIPMLPRVMTGIAAAISGLAAALYVFGPFSDLSARQLAAGPNRMQTGPETKPLVLARTGRSWGIESKHSERQPEPPRIVVAKTDSLR